MIEERIDPTLDLSVVIPCLNEEVTIASCVVRSLAAIRVSGLTGEVLVVDNGSHDRSIQIATEQGARVIQEQRKGYGSAYLRGFAEARGRLVFMGDGDATYPFEDLPRFLAAMDGGAEFVLGDRFAGTMERGAMTWERRLGNRILSTMLRLIYRPGVHDAHCGLRLLSKSAIQRMELSSLGMEFASEMIIAAKRVGVRMSEIPVDYAARPGHNPSKLNLLPDGVRHVRYMLAFAPAGWLLVPAAVLAGSGAALWLAAAGALQVLGVVMAGVGIALVPTWLALRAFARRTRAPRVAASAAATASIESSRAIR